MTQSHQTSENTVDERPSPNGTATPDDLVSLQNVVVRFRGGGGFRRGGGRGILAVDDVSLSIRSGESVGLVGSTGSGKSTLAHVIMGMVRPTSGSVAVGGHDLQGLRPRDLAVVRRMRQIVMQDPYSSLDPRMRIRDIIAEPMTLGRSGRRSRAEIDDRIEHLLDLVGLPAAKANDFPLQFSGGQRQRIAIARALASEPRLIVLDEPTSALDVSVRAQILKLLKDLQEVTGVTYLIISHDLVTVAYLSSRIVVMNRGRVVNTEPTKALYKAPRHPYTLELVTSIAGLQHDPTGGEPDDSEVAVPEGACWYAEQCALRRHLGYPRECVASDPPLHELGDGARSACHFPDEAVRFSKETLKRAAAQESTSGT